jgi:hypothetical protein
VLRPAGIVGSIKSVEYRISQLQNGSHDFIAAGGHFSTGQLFHGVNKIHRIGRVGFAFSNL